MVSPALDRRWRWVRNKVGDALFDFLFEARWNIEDNLEEWINREKAEAWDEGWDKGREVTEPACPEDHNPYRTVATSKQVE